MTETQKLADEMGRWNVDGVVPEVFKGYRVDLESRGYPLSRGMAFCASEAAGECRTDGAGGCG